MMYGYICPICNCHCRWELKYNWCCSPYVNYHCDNCGFNSSEGIKTVATSSIDESIISYTNTTGGVYNKKKITYK